MSRGIIVDAAQFAQTAHAGQRRKYTGQPYIYHPGRVAMRATLLGLKDEQIAAAWLHDVVEDTAVTLGEIVSRFGMEVGSIVHGLTNVYSAKSHPDMNRKQRKAAEFERVTQLPTEVKIIKLLDRIDNLGEMDASDSFIKLYTRESQDLLHALRGTDKALEDELWEKIQKFQ